MIKYPKNKSIKTESSLKAAVDAGEVFLGQRIMIKDNPVTCVDIDDNKYIFSMDEIFKCASYDKMTSILEQIYSTGEINHKEVLPANMMNDIDFLFVPTEFQVFGWNIYGEKEEDTKQFEWYKKGDFTRVKGYCGEDNLSLAKGENCNWRLSTVRSQNSSFNCCVNGLGCASIYRNYNDQIGVPIFFQITRQNISTKSNGNIATNY